MFALGGAVVPAAMLAVAAPLTRIIHEEVN